MPADKRIPVDELLRLACLYAEQDREGFLNCYSSMPNDPAALEAKAFLDQLRAYRKKRWGKTQLQAAMDRGEMTDVRIISKLAE